jgi:serine/threonine-protein kinase RsbW
MEKRFKRDLQSLDDVFEFVEQFATMSGIDEAVTFSMKLAADELFTNFVRHNTGGKDDILISLDIENGRLAIRLSDFDVDPVALGRDEPPDVGLPLDQRPIGGLGIHLVRSMFDSLTYDYRDRTLSVIAVKNLEARHV